MSPEQELLLLAIALYLIECAIVVRRSGLIFWSPGLGATRITDPAGLPGSPDRGVFLCMPLPPLGTVYVVHRWLLALSPRAVALTAPGEPSSAADGRVSIPLEQIERIVTEGEKLRIDNHAVPCGSERLARFIASVLRKVREAPADERADLLGQTLSQTLDLEAARRRAAQFHHEARGVQHACNALCLLCFVVAPAVIWAQGIRSTWVPLLTALLLLWVAAVVLFRRAHRCLLPEDRSERNSHTLLLAVMPLAAIRARDALSRDLLAEWHPIAVAAASCDEEGLAHFARREYLRAYFDSRAASGAAPEANVPNGAAVAGDGTAVAVDRWFRTASLRALEAALTAAGLEPQRLLDPPAPDDESSRSYCPRCLSQYALETGVCDRCNGLSLRPLRTATSELVSDVREECTEPYP